MTLVERICAGVPDAVARDSHYQTLRALMFDLEGVERGEFPLAQVVAELRNYLGEGVA